MILEKWQEEVQEAEKKKLKSIVPEKQEKIIFFQEKIGRDMAGERRRMNKTYVEFSEVTQ